jgi:hypothetical protein
LALGDVDKFYRRCDPSWEITILLSCNFCGKEFRLEVYQHAFERLLNQIRQILSKFVKRNSYHSVEHEVSRLILPWTGQMSYLAVFAYDLNVSSNAMVASLQKKFSK